MPCGMKKCTIYNVQRTIYYEQFRSGIVQLREQIILIFPNFFQEYNYILSGPYEVPLPLGEGSGERFSFSALCRRG